MAAVVAVYDPPLVLATGRVYTAQACGRQRDDGRWEGWLEFVPADGSVVLRSERETTQRNLADLEYWAGGLRPIYLQGALERTLTPRPTVIEPPEVPAVPAVYDEPEPNITPIATAPTEPVLDPFSVYPQGEEVMARRLAALGPRHLRAIILKYNLGNPARVDLDTLTARELTDWIIGAVRGRLAA
jgi:hypothetical protein